MILRLGLSKKADLILSLFGINRQNNLTWFSPWERTLDWNSPFARWFVGGKINASYNTLDIHRDNKI